MAIRGILTSVFLALVLASCCAENKEIARVDGLRGDPAWPAIRAAAEREIARREGNPQWSSSAYYTPKDHTKGVWAVVASGAYPMNRLGDSIDMLIRDSGEVISYVPRMSRHAQANEKHGRGG